MSQILLPRKELFIATKMLVGMKGFIRVEIFNKSTGIVSFDSGFFQNQILDAGRNVMATRSDWMGYCQVGTDGTAPNASQTALVAHHAGTGTIVSGSTAYGQASSSPYYGWKRKTWEFAAGTVAANLSEAGVGWGTTGSTLISRALILDPISQTPTTVTPLIDESLHLTYELRYYSPTADIITPSVTLDGIVYDTTTRAANATGDRWSTDIGDAIGVYSAVVSDWAAYDGSIGTVLTSPSGTIANCDNTDQANSAYSNNSYQMQMSVQTNSTGWILGSGIKSIRIRTTAGDYQTEFTSNPGGNTIPKTAAYKINLSWTLAWAERP